MASNDINTCARRISQHLDTYNAIKSDINDLRAQIIESSGPDKQNLEAVLQIRTQEKTDEARAAINTQIQLLNLVVGSGWTRIPFNIRTALNRIFSGDGLAELRERFELGRDLAISDNGELAGPNPNGMSSFHSSYSFYILTVGSLDTPFSANKGPDPCRSEKATH